MDCDDKLFKAYDVARRLHDGKCDDGAIRGDTETDVYRVPNLNCPLFEYDEGDCEKWVCIHTCIYPHTHTSMHIISMY